MKDTRFNLARLATPISAQATPSSRVDINEEISIKVELNSELEVDDIEAEIWLDEVTGHPDHVGAEYSIASPSMSNYSMVDVFSLGPFSNRIHPAEDNLEQGLSAPLHVALPRYTKISIELIQSLI